MNTSWSRFFVFYLIAILFSNLFRFDLLGFQELAANWSVWARIPSLTLAEGSGVFAGASIALFLLGKKHKISTSFLGTDPFKSIVMAIAPFLLLSIMGVDNTHQINEHSFGLLAGVSTFLYCIAEEYGWRGYLHEEFREWADWKKYLLTGMLWYVWHLSFLRTTDPAENLLFLGGLILGSFGIGQIAKATQSVLASASFHFLINVMMFNRLFHGGISGQSKLIFFIISLSLFFYLIKKWNQPLFQFSKA